jgi:hypothetical protein
VLQEGSRPPPGVEIGTKESGGGITHALRVGIGVNEGSATSPCSNRGEQG